ncbi:hypothetical protein [Curtobacterium sp. VKM Ac-1395]|uniref:hypothetical protein n=1 Tax=Curtobacterium sp. VKM Ac-1395 TaxID=2783815 RepID=UPI00188D139C|nr:hypothetical protein [Curtobacterium sp. VKM Ac-1395]MBF4589396.1 hypothetical protein [Curtobacterium sp. VKM Ac-1395]
MPLGPTTELGVISTTDGTDRAPDDAPVVLDLAADTATCVCGHQQAAHEHYRRGSDCALCDCPRFRKKR